MTTCEFGAFGDHLTIISQLTICISPTSCCIKWHTPECKALLLTNTFSLKNVDCQDEGFVG